VLVCKDDTDGKSEEQLESYR